jgi:hypothetical protein
MSNTESPRMKPSIILTIVHDPKSPVGERSLYLRRLARALKREFAPVSVAVRYGAARDVDNRLSPCAYALGFSQAGIETRIAHVEGSLALRTLVPA